MRADTLTYVTLTAAGELAGLAPYEIEALVDQGTLDAREADGVLFISRVSLNHWMAARERDRLRVVR